jgi:hypothetical protein
MKDMYFSWLPFQHAPKDAGQASGVRREIVLDPSADRDTLIAAIETMTLVQLGLAWRATDQLFPISTPQGAAMLAQLRQLLLDELEASHPRAFKRWMAAGGPGPRRRRS